MAQPTAHGGTPTAYEQVQASSEFADLRRRFRRFVFPTTALFLAWYFLYVLLAAFAPEFMSTKVWGNINIGLLFGLGQFVSTFAITHAEGRSITKDRSSTRPVTSRRCAGAGRRPLARRDGTNLVTCTSTACGIRRPRNHLIHFFSPYQLRLRPVVDLR